MLKGMILLLEVRNLTKIYKPKKGVPVTALDHVSLRFPETGMVFLLGKSGSGKSTLLNLLGGLDRYDTGEILIKGVSSASFKQKHFDSYRNTYVGFIFQEYNILDEFTVGANVALAIELQGRKATDEEIDRILKDVDLAGFGSRKPNELSGGQKQRVAIARALVKNPQIIMADEPTGALDSVTGRQVLDTLKKLSQTKLVLVVSHDRDFAEAYADRIVELSDGKVIRDDEYVAGEAPQTGLTYAGDTITVPPQYHLTEEDREQINAYLDARGSGGTLAVAARAGRKSVPTDETHIPAQKGDDFKLIRSRLPMKFAFKMGANGLKYKKVRLVFTILLSCVAFTLFGLADAFGAYDYVTTCTDSLIDSHIDYATLVKEAKNTYSDGEVYYNSYGHYISRDDLAKLQADTGLTFSGVYVPSISALSSSDYFGEAKEGDYVNSCLWSRDLIGFADLPDGGLEAAGAKLVAGRLPDGQKDEIVLSSYFAQGFVELGFIDRDNGKDTAEKIGSVSELVGKSLLGYTIVGIADTNVDIPRYRTAYDGTFNENKLSDMLLAYALEAEFENLQQYSLACTAIVGKGFVDRLDASLPTVYGTKGNLAIEGETEDGGCYMPFERIVDASTVDPALITWKEGVTSLGENEVLLSRNDAEGLFWNFNGSSDNAALLEKLDGVELEIMSWNDNTYEQVSRGTVQVVGIVDMEFWNGVFANDSFVKSFGEETDGIFEQAVAPMPANRADIRKLVAAGADEKSDVRFAMQNPVCFELSAIGDVLKVLSPVFAWIGVFFAIFAMLLLANFISVSINNKKREIGILRAIGSRGNDVFRIFFSESFIIAMIEFVLASLAVAGICAAINTGLRNELGILVTAVSYGIRQIGLELVLALATAAIASFLPVKRIAAKKPIDAIRSI